MHSAIVPSFRLALLVIVPSLPCCISWGFPGRVELK